MKPVTQKQAGDDHCYLVKDFILQTAKDTYAIH